jgi:DHA2 family multidrug resistance protein
LAGLEYVLEEGPKNDWFGDTSIAAAAWIAFIAFLLFLERSFRSTSPIVKLTPFRKPTFVFACIFNLVIGFGLYAGTYLVPLFLGRVRGYNANEIGTTVFIAGIVQFCGVPIAAALSQRVDQRIIITFGLSLFAAGLWLFSYMTPDWGFAALLLPQAVRSFAIMLCIVPSVGLALNGFAGPELRYASGLFNLMRNLGGAIGIALVTTWLQDLSKLHALRLSETLGASAKVATDTLQSLAHMMQSITPDPAQAMLMAESVMGRFVAREALTLAFNDVFRIMAWLFIVALVMVPFCRPPKQASAEPIEAH